MPKRNLYLVAYDITESSRRARALKVCKGHGLGGQKSVHECWLSRSEQRELQTSFMQIIDADTDRFAIIRFESRTQIFVLGRGREPETPPFFYVD